jgi:hypothetical protein
MRAPAAILLRAAHSHLYPGSVVAAENVPARIAAPRAAVIEFADGSGATATLSPLDDGALELAVDAYVTHTRHAVAARRWHLHAVDAARTAWRIARRLPAT